jgi:aminoglycoside phosphotransferase (APT) family kinase protein
VVRAAEPRRCRSRQEDRRWTVVGQVAATIHALPAAGFEDVVPGHDTRREHAEACLRQLAGLDDAVAREAHAWASERMPAAEPSVLVHGDLLGQNILVGLDQAPAVIDWEYAVRGDPAYDLAIVTRGVKRPFQVVDGLDRLLDAYMRHRGSTTVTRAHVRVHELCLVASWYADALAGAAGARPAAEELGRLRGLLARAQREG